MPATLAFLDAARQRGFEAAPDWEFNGATQENGAGYVQKNILGGRRHSAADAYLLPALTRPNLVVISQAHATSLVVEGKRVVGLDTCGMAGERWRARRAKWCSAVVSWAHRSC